MRAKVFQMRFWIVALVATGLMTFSGLTGMPSEAAAEEEWKPKRVDIVLSHSLGGGQDRLTRALVKVWGKELGTKLRIVPKHGASGRVGTDFFVKAKRDGTVLLSSNLATIGVMYIQQQPGWKWDEQIEPLALFGLDPAVMFVLKDSPYKSVKDVVAAAKEKPMAVGVSQWSTSDNMVVHQLIDQTKANFRAVPAGGGSAVVTAVLGGHVPVAVGKISNVRKGGDRLRVLAVAMKKNPVPDITNNAPTVDGELGTNTAESASYRTINVHPDLKKNYPGRYKKLKESLEKTKDTPEYIKAAKRAKVSKDLILDLTTDQLNAAVESYWEGFQESGAFYQNAPGLTTLNTNIVDMKKKGKQLLYTGKDGKKAKISVARSTKISVDGKKLKGKKGRKALAKGMNCDITWQGTLALVAREVKCNKATN